MTDFDREAGIDAQMQAMLEAQGMDPAAAARVMELSPALKYTLLQGYKQLQTGAEKRRLRRGSSKESPGMVGKSESRTSIQGSIAKERSASGVLTPARSASGVLSPARSASGVLTPEVDVSEFWRWRPVKHCLN